jgi:hypothetical protein
LIDFFASLQNETVNIFYNPAQNPVQTMQPPVLMLQQQQQTGGHNPFRTNTNDMGMSLVTTQNTSNVSNPFRASTMPPFSTSAPSYNQQPPSLFTQQLTNVQPMSSLSSPSNNPFASQQVVLASSPTKMMESLNNNINNNNPFTNMAQKQQQQTMWTGGGGNGIF